MEAYIEYLALQQSSNIQILPRLYIFKFSELMVGVIKKKIRGLFIYLFIY